MLRTIRMTHSTTPTDSDVAHEDDSRRRILLVFPRAPIPFGNADARWYFVLLKGLVERGHDVTALAACSTSEEMTAASDLFPRSQFDLRCHAFPKHRGPIERLRNYFRPHSFMFSEEFRRGLQELLANRYDVLHLEQLWSGWLGLEATRRSLVNIHYLGSVDLSFGATPMLRRECRIAESLERRLIPRFQYFRTLSDRLKAAVREKNPRADVTTVPIGIDLDLYQFIPDSARHDSLTVSLIGTMNWYPTATAARRLITRLWPEIKRRVPAARLHLVGWNARDVLHEFLAQEDVEITQNVVDSRDSFADTSVLVYAPECATGMKIKILESLALGIPVVTTTEGVEGLPAVDGLDAAICEDDAGLIDRTVRLLQNREEQNRQRRAGRDLVERICGPDTTVSGIEQIHRRMTQTLET